MAPNGPGPTPATPRLSLLTSASSGPTGPGVYVFKAPGGQVLYVGKARNLRKRVQDHLRRPTEKDEYLAAHASTVEFLPTRNEREALLLEANLIREEQPRYNVLLKDDRSFPYIAVTLDETYPRLLVVRRPRRGKGTALFGPYTGAREARSLAHILTETFQLRQCRRLPPRECLYFHIKTCSGPCIGAIDGAAYRARVDSAILVLKGQTSEVFPALTAEMKAASARLDFERAGQIRDALRALDALKDRQSVMDAAGPATDVVGLALPESPGSSGAAVGLLRLREGAVVQATPHLLSVPDDVAPLETDELLADFLLQRYTRQGERPDVILLPLMGPHLRQAVAGLQTLHPFEARVAKTGRPRSLMALAEAMARAHLASHAAPRPPESVMKGLMALLQLPRIPRHIEGVDISLFQGNEAVGSLVVFRNGLPSKDDYRRFKIRTVEGTNDFAMIHEVVSRRYQRQVAEAEKLPDLLLIDGGAGQLAAARAALEEVGASEIPTIGLAKREEEIYVPDRAEPLRPSKNSPPVLLLRAVRDEAHRFAVTYHRTRRRMAMRGEERAAAPDFRPASGLPPAQA